MTTFISDSITIKELLDPYPHLLSTFVDLGLMCVGCPANAFHNLVDVAREYGLDQKELIDRLKIAIGEKMNPETNR